MHVLRSMRGSMPGGLHFHGLELRSKLFQPGRLRCGFRQVARGDGMGPGIVESDGSGGVQVDGGAGVDETARPAAASETGAGCRKNIMRNRPLLKGAKMSAHKQIG